MTPSEQRILDCLQSGEKTTSEVAHYAGVKLHTARMYLRGLEVQGMVQRRQERTGKVAAWRLANE